jgi:hypothetical protein
VRFGSSYWHGLAGTLISPARGLFVYVPIVLFVLYLLIRYRRYLRQRLTILAVGIICVHVIIIAGYVRWYGGHSYGPRYCTDIVPWFALLTMLAIEARSKWALTSSASNFRARSRVEWSVAALLLTWSIAINGIGAISERAFQWNTIPTNIDNDHGRLWDWKHPPFLEPIAPTGHAESAVQLRDSIVAREVTRK